MFRLDILVPPAINILNMCGAPDTTDLDSMNPPGTINKVLVDIKTYGEDMEYNNKVQIFNNGKITLDYMENYTPT